MPDLLARIKTLLRKPAPKTQEATRLEYLEMVALLSSCYERIRADAVALSDYLALTRTLDEHPDNFEQPCECAMCQSYADS
jgi:hypothetical protein